MGTGKGWMGEEESGSTLFANLWISRGGSVLRRRMKNRRVVVVVLDSDVDRRRSDLSIPAITLIPKKINQ